MLFVLLVDAEGFLIQSMLSRNPGNFPCIVVLKLVDIANDLSFICADSSEQQQILQIAIVAEW